MTNHTGLNLELLALVAAANQLQIRYVAVPWKRCLAGLARGAMTVPLPPVSRLNA